MNGYLGDPIEVIKRLARENEAYRQMAKEVEEMDVLIPDWMNHDAKAVRQNFVWQRDSILSKLKDGLDV